LWAGGILRALKIAKLAESAGLPIVPHSPRAGVEQAPLLHYLAAIAGPGPFHEFKAGEYSPPWETEGTLVPKAGSITLPEGAGFGIRIVPASLGALTVV
jgi:L-alanine-DL-glutamate epimerase-like enolase superfamily enzyme